MLNAVKSERKPISRKRFLLASSYIAFGVLWLFSTNTFLISVYGKQWPEVPVAIRFLLFLLITGLTSLLFTENFNPAVRYAKRRALEAVTDSQELFESVFNHTTDPMVVFDLNACIKRFNPAFAKMYGYSQAELNGSIIPIIPKDHVDTAFRYFDMVKSGQAPYVEFTGPRIRKDGSVLEAMIKFSPLRNAFGKVIGVSSIVKDITEIRKAQERQVHSEKLVAVGELAAGIAHEIRNPLTAIKGFVQILPSSPPEKQIMYSKLINGELNRVENIVNELLVLAKPNVKQYKPANLQASLVEVVYLLEAQANLQNVKLVTQFEEDVPEIVCNENQLKQVFINLTKNAIEATPLGGTLTIQLCTLVDSVEIQFRDTGEGIPPDKLKQLGNPFFTTKESGTGLGLLVSKRIIENHQGSFYIDSQVGTGTTVRIVLPIK
ncbi:ATP-binding protein [Alicyclobacillus dauci]|uniref:histidine kinase n=1 Tax=Alicyclobacillus dauci TaxID=1475485 RepID=A0ABY6Z6G0_9BACL|nr:ATP-binding protein [Alicyclobacillus dauci]WAH37844.1 ATP-binding protein [Alicyclobacillus dauci]